MTQLIDHLKFKFEWRSYQQGFLDNFEDHIEDNHLHVVAPPGSGKTILGLEVLRRVNKRTLVLAPTLTIRNQWKDRLVSFFLSDASFSDCSMDLRAPKLLTFSTYQSLHALSKRFAGDGDESLLKFVTKNGIKTIVLDEAHHLKNEWYKCLMALKKIEGLTVIALTATPPYDSSGGELEKYFELCGPIDDEIAVPDLVKNGDLCPHQDFVYFSKPSEAQIKYIVTYRENIIRFTNELKADRGFQQLLLEHPFYADTEDRLEEIYAKPSFLSALLIFLNSAGVQIDKEKLLFLGFEGKNVEFPALTYEWIELLLQELLVAQREDLIVYESLLDKIEKRLGRIGVYEKKRVNFVGDERLYRSLASSSSKLRSIHNILEEERKVLGNQLKAVVLTDFIRKEFLEFKGEATAPLNKLGVVSVFQYLRIKLGQKDDLAILTGSLVVLHKKLTADFEALLGGDAAIGMKPMSSDSDFVEISVSGTHKNRIVGVVTRLFQLGKIKILIGTKSLLGEGWDAPAINTLVLASYVGSFVSSNQMRGRAIRTDTNDPDKSGNIWHLACLDPTATDGGKDLEKLKRRFTAFSGVSIEGEAYIENGLDRLQLPEHFSGEAQLDELNKTMIDSASNREALKQRWHEAIDKGSVLVREVKIPYAGKTPFRKAKKMRSVDAAQYLLIELVAGLGLFLPEFLMKNITTLLNKGVFVFMYFLLAGIIIGFAPKTYKALKLYFLFGNAFKKTKKIANALLDYLMQTGQIHTEHSEVSVSAEQQANGAFVCCLKGASNYEGNLFVQLLHEILAPVENPRYLLIGNHWLKKKWGIRKYYVVPQSLGRRKEDALGFHRFWKKHVDDSKLLYTRTRSGRKELLKARLAHVVYQFKEVSEKTITWK
ncbi:DEAD/DEAH box helicase family protein [Zobellia uliginosa]|uniref:DEAD/DEAH box helicase family protein n=1 Tax=Zobellia uliginosa TaxID=143224 RepID=UPI0026E36063|nr:DEAD/DEAH box helicase family protein [Zobellia uliginosa]MDO6516271.1 DEAD/DEAH box helicase family protein [Zobellia uliginosa]